jgi:hypothetical protein
MPSGKLNYSFSLAVRRRAIAFNVFDHHIADSSLEGKKTSGRE